MASSAGKAIDRRRAARVVARLRRWYAEHARDLPWRRSRDPYRIWLSEVMLQQTRVDTVLPYYRRWLQALPTVEALAAADEEVVLKLWEGLGYYRRARNLHRAARRIVTAGEWPSTAAGWQALPGVGRYTAGAVASIAFGEPAPVLDGNVKRVLARLEAIAVPIEARATVERLWALAAALVPRERPGDVNQALMELGARVCLARRPQCPHCPLGRLCRARAAGLEETLPRRRPRRRVPSVVWVAARLRRGGRTLFAKRPAGGLLGGLWELPSGEAAAGERHGEALRRLCAERLGLEVEAGAERAVVDHVFTHLKVRIHLYDCRIVGGRAEARHHTAVRWLGARAGSALALPVAMRKLLAQLTDGDSGGDGDR